MKSSGKSLCRTFQELGDDVSRNLHLAYGSAISYSEETITESTLLEIWRRHSTEVNIRTYTKRQEARNGADWEWHLIGLKYTLKMRVQAKRLPKNTLQFPGLFTYKAKSAPHPQIDMLIAEAKRDRLLPILCFYSEESAKSRWRKSVMSSRYEVGCLIGDARRIKRHGYQDIASLEARCVPWHFLVCSQQGRRLFFPSVGKLNGQTQMRDGKIPTYIVPTDEYFSQPTREADGEYGPIGLVTLDCRNL
ncbi:DUF6615 family protein [Ochrobactrum teleogrylli]|uniref:Uncharacterized protein n=1 Tax=Ochrobactrum teleogrylli TaxID=2479765 RepID=A0ABY2XZ56_9HYPH|nr:DUF6615 family protein [[Ochrobactrum] teleogrylli]TNV10460.1 hypothetical protein FIC94_20445 [[Ochrobactrum] teleogrylli]